jgi:hypothetical protein
MYGIESAMSHKMLIFNAEIDFSSPADNCRIVCMLKMWRLQGGSQESIPQRNRFSQEIDAYKNSGSALKREVQR